MITYPVKVLAVDANGTLRILCRLGGGGHTGLDERYYPTVLWTIENDWHIFCPEEKRDAWHGSGPDKQGPYTVYEVLQWHTSNDPMNATARGFAAEFAHTVMS